YRRNELNNIRNKLFERAVPGIVQQNRPGKSDGNNFILMYKATTSMNRVLLSAIFVSCAILMGCEKKQPPPNPEVPVNLMKLKPKSVSYYDKYPATTRALNQVNLLPQVTGAITGMFFTEGGEVSKGQKLYEIDERL